MTILQRDDEIKVLLERTRTIAVVGLSDNPARDSYQVARYLMDHDYVIYPVNPRITSFMGLTSYPSLEMIRQPVDLVDVFRRPEHLPALVESALRIEAKGVWTQLGVSHPAAAARAASAGLAVVMDRCIMVEHSRLVL